MSSWQKINRDNLQWDKIQFYLFIIGKICGEPRAKYLPYFLQLQTQFKLSRGMVSLFQQTNVVLQFPHLFMLEKKNFLTQSYMPFPHS